MGHGGVSVDGDGRTNSRFASFPGGLHCILHYLTVTVWIEEEVGRVG